MTDFVSVRVFPTRDFVNPALVQSIHVGESETRRGVFVSYGFAGGAVKVQYDTEEQALASVEAFRIAATRQREAADPAENWCEAKLQNGKRCSMDAVKDGLCKRHWREAEGENMTQRRDGAWGKIRHVR